MQQTVNSFINKYQLHTDEQTRYVDLVSEIGELGKEILKATNYGRQKYKQTSEAIDEMGDCLFSMMTLCSQMNIDAKEALNRAISKYEARFKQKGSVESDV